MWWLSSTKNEDFSSSVIVDTTCSKHIYFRLWLYGFFSCFQCTYIYDNAWVYYHQSLCTIIIIIKQLSPTSKIIIIFKTIIIKVHRTFLNIYHYIINDDPVLSTTITFLFFKRLLDALINTWNSQNLKKLLWSLPADRIYFHLTVAGAAYGV